VRDVICFGVRGDVVMLIIVLYFLVLVTRQTRPSKRRPDPGSQRESAKGKKVGGVRCAAYLLLDT
jgi:hypothetical protein